MKQIDRNDNKIKGNDDSKLNKFQGWNRLINESQANSQQSGNRTEG